MQSNKSYLPKIFLDKSEIEKINVLREKMRHSINAGDINKLRAFVDEVQEDAELKDVMKLEVNFCNQRIEINTLHD